MCGSSTTTSSSGPPQQFLDAYTDVLGQANAVTQQPLQQYDAGPDASNIVAPWDVHQLDAFYALEGAQGNYQPYMGLAGDYMTAGAQPWDMNYTFDVGGLTGAGLDAYSQAMRWAQMGAPPEDYGAALQGYLDPWTNEVVNTTADLFNNQNAEQFNQGRGNAISQGAFGGDREAVMASEMARQQASAQDPVLAGLRSTGYTNAQQAMTAEQQMALQAAGIASGIGGHYWDEFNKQQGVDEAHEALMHQIATNAGYGFGSLGQLVQSLSGNEINAWLAAGNQIQAHQQQKLNVPYEQFMQRQAWPYQNVGWLANIATGLGGSAGGTASTTYPPPSTIGQIGGLATAGAGVYGLGTQSGWWGGSSSPGTGSWAPETANPYYMGTWDGGGNWSGVSAADGGAIPQRAPGGMVPDLSESPIPGAMGFGTPPAKPGGGMMTKAFLQPNTSQTQSSSAGLGSILGPALSIGKLFLGANDGGAVDGYDNGGMVPQARGLAVPPDLSRPVIPALQMAGRGFGPPAPPAMSQQAPQQPNQFENLAKGFKDLAPLFKSKEADGGAVASGVLQYDDGGFVPRGTDMGGGDPIQQQALLQRYSMMPPDQIRDMAGRFPPGTPQGQALQQLMKVRAPVYPGGNYPTGPMNPMPSAAARGGRMGLAEGGAPGFGTLAPPFGAAHQWGAGAPDVPYNEMAAHEAGGDPLQYRMKALGLPPEVARSILFNPSYGESDSRMMPPAARGAFDAELGASAQKWAGEGRDEALIRGLGLARDPSREFGLADGGDVLGDWRDYIEPPPKREVPPPPSYRQGLAGGGDADLEADPDAAPPPRSVTPDNPFAKKLGSLIPSIDLRTPWARGAQATAVPAEKVIPASVAAPPANLVTGLGAPEAPFVGLDSSAFDEVFDTAPAGVIGTPSPGFPEPRPSGWTQDPVNNRVQVPGVNPDQQVAAMQNFRAAIGAPPGYTDMIIGVESQGNPLLRSKTSSAEGLGQFVDATWLDVVKRYHPEVASGKTDQQILGMKRSADPASVTLQRQAIDDYAKDNGEKLAAAGFEPNAANLSLAHLLGPGGAAATLSANPGASMRSVVGDAAIAANPWMAKMTASDMITSRNAMAAGAKIAARRGAAESVGSSGLAGDNPGGGGGDDITKAARQRGLAAGFDDTSSGRDEGWRSAMNSPWMALIAAGAGMLASRSPHPGVALGEGMETGLKFAGQMYDRDTKAEMAEVKRMSERQKAEHMAEKLNQAAENQARLAKKDADLADWRMTNHERLTAKDTTNAGLTAQGLDLRAQLARVAETNANTAIQNATTHAAAQKALAKHQEAQEEIARLGTGDVRIINGVMEDAKTRGETIDFLTAQRLVAQAKHNPDEFMKTVRFEHAIASAKKELDQSMDPAVMSLSNPQKERKARQIAADRFGLQVPGLTTGVAPAAPAKPAAPAAGAPVAAAATPPPKAAWSNGDVRRLNGKPIATDGTGWFYVNPDGSKGAAAQ